MEIVFIIVALVAGCGIGYLMLRYVATSQYKKRISDAEKEAEVQKLEQAAAAAQNLAETTGDTSQIASTTVAAKQAGANLKMLRLRRDVTISYQQLIGSIVRVIDYYNSKNRDAAIDNIIITTCHNVLGRHNPFFNGCS